jgi:hypothetical protein
LRTSFNIDAPIGPGHDSTATTLGRTGQCRAGDTSPRDAGLLLCHNGALVRKSARQRGIIRQLRMWRWKGSVGSLWRPSANVTALCSNTHRMVRTSTRSSSSGSRPRQGGPSRLRCAHRHDRRCRCEGLHPPRAPTGPSGRSIGPRRELDRRGRRIVRPMAPGNSQPLRF